MKSFFINLEDFGTEELYQYMRFLEGMGFVYIKGRNTKAIQRFLWVNVRTKVSEVDKLQNWFCLSYNSPDGISEVLPSKIYAAAEKAVKIPKDGHVII